MGSRKIKTEKKTGERKKIYIYTAIVFIILFVIINGIVHWELLSQKNAEKEKAAYTAETTVHRMEAYLNQYISTSDLLKQIIETDNVMDDEQFNTLAEFMMKGNDALLGIELAKDGIVTQVYPKEQNEAAVGLNLLTHPERREWTTLAKETGNYTMAGPFELVQGGRGVLLINPIYCKQDEGEKEFWGFSVLVVDWECVLDKLGLLHPDDSFYHYKIWSTDLKTGDQTILVSCKDEKMSDPLIVPCEIHNGTWYVEIEPAKGWISKMNLLIDSAICFLIAGFVAMIYMQYALHRQEERAHNEEIMLAAMEIQKASEAKTRFLFNMSHDLRTPLNALIGFSELLEKHIDDRERAQEYVKKILASSNILLSIINHILEMSRIESGKETLHEEVGSAKELIKEIDAVFEPSIREKQLNCEYNVQVTHEYAIFDVTKVQEIFLNIMSNSVKYTPKGGKITANVTEISSEGDKSAVYRIVVEDTGIGMSEEFLPHLFEEFARERTSTETKVVGTGLGMPIVKALVDLMGGTIRVESKEGCGTKTTVDLPLSIASEKQIEESRRRQRRDDIREVLADKKILLAEDNDLNAEIAMTILTENGLFVERAEDGKRCIEMLKQRPEEYYAAILMDIQMPRMDGYEATKAIRQLDGSRASIPIIAMTANAFEEDRKRALEVGMDGYIAKPIHMESVLDALQEGLVGKH